MWNTGSDADEPEWRIEETPFSKTLYEVVDTAYGPYAIGDRGTLVGRVDGDWEVVLDDGPATRDNQLRGLDVTDDGERLWFLGSSGAMGCFDIDEMRKYDYSYPKEMTSTWEGIAVAGERGSEKVLASNGSGEVLPFQVDGFDVDWGSLRKPVEGKASKIAGLAASEDGVGYAIDTSGNAFRTTEDDGWEDIGIVNAQVKFYDVYAGLDGRVYVAAGDGRIYRYDDSYHSWTPIGVSENGEALRAVDLVRTDGGVEMVALGNSGSIFQRVGDERWERLHTPTSANLLDLTLGHPDVAVGGSGTVLTRLRGETRFSGTSPDGDNFDGRGEDYDDGVDESQDDPAGDDTTDDREGGTSGDDTNDDADSEGGTSGDDTNDDADREDSKDGTDGSDSDTHVSEPVYYIRPNCDAEFLVMFRI